LRPRNHLLLHFLELLYKSLLLSLGLLLVLFPLLQLV
jgi:hypothetical protein